MNATTEGGSPSPRAAPEIGTQVEAQVGPTRSPLHRALSTLVLVSRFPVPLRGEPDFSGLPFWLPFVGFLAAAVVAAAWFLSSLAFATGGARAFCALVALFLAFDLFHFDGLLDSADAFLGAGSREKRLEILKDPRIGSFGLFAGTTCLGALWYCAARAAELPLSMAPVALAAPVAGRAAASLVPVFLRPARPGGLGAMIQPYSRIRAIAGITLSAAICLAIAWLAAVFSDLPGADPAASIAAMATGLVCGIAAGSLPITISYHRGVGGYTGDALGAAVLVGTLAHLAASLASLGVL